ncbi:MAG: hypothetical protein LBP59_19435 [Planctomycetaceae bacterium]|jgi:hypothetical protein|nr:hypothetical protein [Planctomycetaceae bacterium]
MTKKLGNIQIVLEIQRFKSVKACRPKARQAKVNENSMTNSLNVTIHENFFSKYVLAICNYPLRIYFLD